MSKSYKHTPYAGQQKNRYMKKLANRKVRRMLKNPDISLSYKSYKKAFESWDICDYYHKAFSFNKYYHRQINRWYQWHNRNEKESPSEDEIREQYKRWYVRK